MPRSRSTVYHVFSGPGSPGTTLTPPPPPPFSAERDGCCWYCAHMRVECRLHHNDDLDDPIVWDACCTVLPRRGMRICARDNALDSGDLERVGRYCTGCTTPCKQYQRAPSLQDDPI
jgi:hypothetical protein